jgi:hypothetical protein
VVKIETIASNILKVTPTEELKTNDFRQIAPQVDAVIRQYGKIRILVDATNFNGWENMDAFEKHMGFIKSHHKSIERGAIIAGQAWQHWLAGVIRLFVHPQIRVFDKNQQAEAEQWIAQ